MVNGDIFRWRRLWPRLAADFEIQAAPYPGRPTPLEPQLADAGPIWADIAAKHDLAEPDLGKLASAWHTDLNLGREIEVVTDMTKSRLAGFHEFQPTLGSFLNRFARLRRERFAEVGGRHVGRVHGQRYSCEIYRHTVSCRAFLPEQAW
jgi:hypothetical protein